MAINNKGQIECVVQSTAFGGEGIARCDGKVVFVPGALEGERINIRLVQQKKSYARAQLLEVVNPSPKRIQPLCEFFAQCGGCHFQHLDYSSQLDIKKNFVEDALKRIGRIDVSVHGPQSSKEQWYYRRHIRLHWHNGRLGFMQNKSHALVEASNCHIFSEREIIPKIRKLCHSLGEELPYEISVHKSGEQFILFFEFSRSRGSYKKIFAKEIENNELIKGVIWKVGNQFFELGNVVIQFPLGNLIFSYNPKVFVQANPQQSEGIYNEISLLAKKNKMNKILDLYCGFGASSILLRSMGIELCGIEVNPESIRLARLNEKTNKLYGIRWIAGDVEKLAGSAFNEFQPDCVLVNPPRTGLASVVCREILEYLPEHIIYISCMPATLARDISALSCFYRVEYCQSFDMFPQTTHIETLVYLKRKEL
ncbi:MAG: class I SAM-dependent RNA methyltransferase [Myxococcales bacterium]|nr:MAG: class I SAM-dependent RNA methyltransferase [Myxococcales bacterium]